MDRKPARITINASLMAILLTVIAGAASGEEIAGIEFPATWDVDGQTLVLNGAGVREYGVFGIDVYAAALYLPEPMRDALAILKHSDPKLVHMHAFRAASAEDTARAWKPYLSDNCRADCVYPRKQARLFLNRLPETVEGDTQTYVFTGNRVEMLRNGRFIDAIEGGGFARLLLSTWIGEAPSTEALKDALLGGH